MIYPKEKQFEPPHVYIFMGGESVCRIELVNHTLMDEPPPGNTRDILAAYQRHAETISQAWQRYHGG